MFVKPFHQLYKLRAESAVCICALLSELQFLGGRLLGRSYEL